MAHPRVMIGTSRVAVALGLACALVAGCDDSSSEAPTAGDDPVATRESEASSSTPSSPSSTESPVADYIQTYCVSIDREIGRLNDRFEHGPASNWGPKTPTAEIKQDTLGLEAEIESTLASIRARLAGAPPPDIRHGDVVTEVLDENFRLAIGGVQKIRATVAATSPTAAGAQLTLAGQAAGLGFALLPLGLGPIDLQTLLDGQNDDFQLARPTPSALRKLPTPPLATPSSCRRL